MLTPPSRAALLAAARAALLHRLRTGTDPPAAAGNPPPVTCADLAAPCGCFVSLHERGSGRLRGCVGRLDPARSVWEAVTLAAADVLRDPRFTNHPVTLADVPDLEMEVSVLSPPREAASPTDFSLLEHGIHLVIGPRCGFFLPQVARETGWTKEHLLGRLCTEKLHLPADAWRKPGAKLFTFTVEVIGPEPVEEESPEC